MIGAGCLIGTVAYANPPVDEIKRGLCLDLKVNGTLTPCNHSLRLVDDGRGSVTFVTGYGEGRREPKTVAGFATTQTPDMENAYGYALRVTGVTLMAAGAAADTQREHVATGLCFMVKPSTFQAFLLFHRFMLTGDPQ